MVALLWKPLKPIKPNGNSMNHIRFLLPLQPHIYGFTLPDGSADAEFEFEFESVRP